MTPAAEIDELVEKLEEAQHRCQNLQQQIDLLLTDRTATEKKAIELMRKLCEDQKRRYEKEIDSLKEIIKENEADKEHYGRLNASFAARAKNLEKEVVRLEDELRLSNAALDDFKEQINKESEDEIAALKVLNNNLQERIAKLDEDGDSLKRQLADEQERKDKMDEELVKLNGLLVDSQEAWNRLFNEVSEVKLKKAALRCRLMEAEKENKRLKDERSNHLVNGTPTEVELDSLQHQLSESQEQFERRRDELKKSRDEADALRAQLSRCTEQIEVLRRDYDDARAELDDARLERGAEIRRLEERVADLTEQNSVLKEVAKDSEVQNQDLLKLHNKYKMQNESLSDENQQLHVGLQKLKIENDKLEVALEKMKKEKLKYESSVKYWRDEMTTTEKDYKEELINLGRLIASEKGVTLDYVKELEKLKDSKREAESQLHKTQSLLQEAKKELSFVEQEKHLFEQKVETKIADLDDKHREKEKKAKKLLQDTMDLAERYKKEADEFKRENDALRSEAQTHEHEVLKLNSTILQFQKLNTHLQTQLANVPKRGCFLCPEKKTFDQNALTTERMEQMLADYRQQNADLSLMVRTLQNTLKDEKTKYKEVVRKPKDRIEIVGRDIAIIKKTASVSSDISTGSSCLDGGRMRHNIPHRWTKHFVTRRTKCMACMEDLPFSSHCAKCDACKTTVHHRCAENLMNTCGLPMLYSDHFFEEEKRLQKSLCDARMYGWVKLWRSESDSWIDCWACLENGTVCFYRSASDVSQKAPPAAKIDLRSCTWKIHLRSGGEKNESCSVPSNELPFVIEIKINADESQGVQRYYMVMPDLVSKQRWLAAFQKAIPNPITTANQIHF